MTPLARSKYSPERAVRSRYTARMCSVREATRSRSIEAGMGAVALMRRGYSCQHPDPVRLTRPPLAQRRAADLARARARQRVGELDDARVLVGRRLGLRSEER